MGGVDGWGSTALSQAVSFHEGRACTWAAGKSVGKAGQGWVRRQACLLAGQDRAVCPCGDTQATSEGELKGTRGQCRVMKEKTIC
eukprot:1158104-Pelagomonas_calceolata.AAC.2